MAVLEYAMHATETGQCSRLLQHKLFVLVLSNVLSIVQGAKARHYKTYISCSIIVHSSSSSSVIGALAEDRLQLLVLDLKCRYLRNKPNSRSIQVFKEMN